jgi:hypothetical protein
MAAPTAGCLFTIVKNVSGGTKHFGFLPPHGRTLDADEELHIFGDIFTAIHRNAGHRRAYLQDKLGAAINDGDLEIKTSPCVVVYDPDNLASYRVGVYNGTVLAQVPDWNDDVHESIGESDS